MRREVRSPVALGGHLPHQLIGMQAALHQQFAFGLADQRDAALSRGIAMGHVDKRITADVETMGVGNAG